MPLRVEPPHAGTEDAPAFNHVIQTAIEDVSSGVPWPITAHTHIWWLVAIYHNFIWIIYIYYNYMKDIVSQWFPIIFTEQMTFKPQTIHIVSLRWDVCALKGLKFWRGHVTDLTNPCISLGLRRAPSASRWTGSGRMWRCLDSKSCWVTVEKNMGWIC